MIRSQHQQATNVPSQAVTSNKRIKSAIQNMNKPIRDGDGLLNNIYKIPLSVMFNVCNL